MATAEQQILLGTCYLFNAEEECELCGEQTRHRFRSYLGKVEGGQMFGQAIFSERRVICRSCQKLLGAPEM